MEMMSTMVGLDEAGGDAYRLPSCSSNLVDIGYGSREWGKEVFHHPLSPTLWPKVDQMMDGSARFHFLC